jgi:alpha-1,2-mannosyltransferase
VSDATASRLSGHLFSDGNAGVDNARPPPLLPRARVLRLCRALLVLEIALFAFFVAGTHGLIVPLKTPTSTDFVSFYAAGSLADAGTPFLAYDQSAHRAAEERASQPGVPYNLFFYPPTFLLVCAALARLPYIPAFVVFETVSLAFYALVVMRILGERDWRVLVPIAAFPPVLWTLGFGQNGLLIAGLFGAATLNVDRRPVVAGMLFGALSLKPHYAILVPAALAGGGRWRALIATACSAAGVSVVSLVVFGWRTWHDFVVAAAAGGGVYGSGRIPFAGFVTPFGAARLLAATPSAAVVVQAVATALAAIFVIAIWRRNLPLSLRAASLAAATLVAVPLGLFYDLVLAGVAGAWVLRGEYQAGARDRLVVTVLYVLCLNPRAIAASWHLPLGLLAVLTLTVLIAASARRERQVRTGCEPNPEAPPPAAPPTRPD